MDSRGSNLSWREAFSLSKEEVRRREPPGTVRLIEHELHSTDSGNGTDGKHLRLVPMPSNSPADPLNWPTWRRYAVLFTMCYYAFTADFTSGVVSPALTLMQPQIQPPQSFASLTHLVSVNVLMFGVSNIIWVPLGNIFGRRVVLTVSMLVFVFASMWCGLAKTFGSLLAARAIQGFFAGPAYTIAPDIVGDVFFVHERGRAMAVYTACLASGPLVGGIAGGYIGGRLGYKYLFWISTALAGVQFLLELFLVPETLFARQQSTAQEDISETREEKADVNIVERLASEQLGHSQSFHPMSMGLYRGKVIHYFSAPWLSLAFPGTWVFMLQYGALVGATVTQSTIAPMILSAPPYLWGDNVGLINMGGIVGVAVGAGSTYFLADLLMARKANQDSHGLAEPETRLPAVAPGVVLATTGLWTFGFCAAHPSSHSWIGFAFGIGMVCAGLSQIPSIGFNYLIDSYNVMSADCFVMTTIVRAVVAFAWTYFVAEWIEKDGAALPFGILGMIMGIFGLMTLPLWIFGKRMRIATAKHLPGKSDQ